MATCNESIIHSDHSSNPTSSAHPAAPLPPWLCYSVSNPTVTPQYYHPSVTLSLSSSTIAATPTNSWLQSPQHGSPARVVESNAVHRISQCYKDLEESYHMLIEHNKEAAWRLKRVEMVLETEKACRKRQKIVEIEARVKAIKEEEKRALERIEMEYRQQFAELRRESEAKEQKLYEQWVSKHTRLTKCVQLGKSDARLPEANARRL